jgi:hypothetical protein
MADIFRRRREKEEKQEEVEVWSFLAGSITGVPKGLSGLVVY